MNFEKYVTFAKPIGIELTFIPAKPSFWHRNSANYYPDYFTSYNDSWCKLAFKYKALAKREKIPGYQSIHADPGCVEFPSPILKSWSSARAWYEQALSAAEQMGLTPYEKTQEGGCGHIHMGNLSSKQRIRAVVEAYKHPYLSWFFASPNVVKYCQSIANHIKTTPSSTLPDEYVFSYAHNKRIPYILEILDKRAILSNRNHTLEWRAFDSAASWEEQASHIAFYQRFVAYSQRANTGKFSDLSKDYALAKVLAYRNDFNACVKGMKSLIASLELEWKDYSYLVDVNLKPAFKFGRRL